MRSVLPAHSSAETTTALGLPCRVMICGSVWARSITSDSLALASATVQLSEVGGDDVLAAVMAPSFDYSNQYDYKQRSAVSQPGPIAADALWRFVSRQSPILADEPAPVGQGRALPDQAADRVEAAGVEGGAQARHLFGISLEFSLGADKIGRADGARRVAFAAPFDPERCAAVAVPPAEIRPLRAGTPSGNTSRPPWRP